MIKNMDSLEFLKELPDLSVDINFSDPPYALGSKIIIREDGKPDYSKAVDFMSKWKMPTGDYWEKWFKEAFRTLKHGGYCIMFGMDRQNFMFKYYAHLAGFEEHQSMYWYFLCNDDQTQIFTKRGWLNYDEIKIDDVALTFDYVNGVSVWKKINKVFCYTVKDETMVQIANKKINQVVTLNHRLLVKQRTNPRYEYDSWHFIEAKDLLLKNKTVYVVFPKSAINYESDTKFEKDENYFELLGWIFTDGNYQKGDNSVRITQSSSNKSKVDRIRKLLSKLQIDFKEYKRQRVWKYKNNEDKYYVEHVFYFNGDLSKEIKTKFPNKLPSFDLLDYNFNCRLKLFLGMIGGDGGYKTKNRHLDIFQAFYSNDKFNGSLTSGNKHTSDFFQALCQTLGYSTKLTKVNDKMYITNFSHSQQTEIQSRSKIKEIKYSGNIWSVSVDNQNYLIRRNGIASFTGNSSFPKSSDLSKNLDKHFGEERKVVGKKTGRASTPIADIRGGKKCSPISGGIDCSNITSPSSELAKKYDGYKYSIAPLKQTCEEIMVFHKPYKTGSCLHDTLAYENGDETCGCFALNIDGNRVPTIEEITNHSRSSESAVSKGIYGDSTEQETHQTKGQESGRYPAQTFIDSGIAEILDKQHPNVTGGSINKGTLHGFGGSEHSYGGGSVDTEFVAHNDVGGASKILHKCDYEQLDFDLFQYCSKVSSSERNAGLEGFEQYYKLKNDVTAEIQKEIMRCLNK